jgi:nitrate reductase NapAB chaperone NapD
MQLQTTTQKAMSPIEIAELKKADLYIGKIFKFIENSDIESALNIFDKIESLNNTPINIKKLLLIFWGDAIREINLSKSKKDSVNTYIVKNGLTKLYKIGKTRIEVKKRLSQFNAMTGGKGEVVLVINSDIEKMLHNKYKDKKSHGEWFHLGKNDLKEIKRLYA